VNSPLDNCWYAVATVDSVGEKPVPIELRDTSYVIWRTPDQQLTAVADRCSHREAQLSLGTIEDGCLRCPYHGWTFADEGRCVEVPSSGVGAAIPPGAHLKSLSVEEHHGLVWLCPGAPTSPVPFIDVDEDASFTRLNTDMQTWNCAATRMIDNMLDVAHFPYTHAGTFGREQEREVPKFSLTQLDDTFHGYEYSVVINNEGEAKTMSGGGDDVIGLDMSTGFALPFSVRSTMSYENGIEQVLFMTAAPMRSATATSPARSAFTFVLWRNDDVSETGQGIVDFELEVAKEDQRTLENLRGELPLEHGVLVDVASDKASLEWRRRLKALVDNADT
jgi:phenylpropionate dioxygenase-like ring-hydroxylating dioxygenase large terminal subunit